MKRTIAAAFAALLVAGQVQAATVYHEYVDGDPGGVGAEVDLGTLAAGESSSITVVLPGVPGGYYRGTPYYNPGPPETEGFKFVLPEAATLDVQTWSGFFTHRVERDGGV